MEPELYELDTCEQWSLLQHAGMLRFSGSVNSGLKNFARFSLNREGPQLARALSPNLGGKSLHNCMYTCLFVGRDWGLVREPLRSRLMVG